MEEGKIKKIDTMKDNDLEVMSNFLKTDDDLILKIVGNCCKNLRNLDYNTKIRAILYFISVLGEEEK